MAAAATPPAGAAAVQPPIGDYALIGDCRSAALVSREGSIDWMCLPNMPDPALFALVLDSERGGCFYVRPAGGYRVRRRYLPQTNVLETTFTTGAGELVVTDCMPILSESALEGGLNPQRELLRRLEVRGGSVEVEVLFAPRPHFGRRSPALRRRGALGFGCRHGGHALLLHTTLELHLDEGRQCVHGRRVLAPGERHYLSLVYASDGPLGLYPLAAEADRRIAATVRWWALWCSHFSYQGPWREPVLRSALTLKLLAFALSGAVLAAPTTSLPEHIGGERNWDYRYCWLRDASLVLRAFHDLGYPGEGEAFLQWLLHSTRLTWPRLQVMYDVYGETELHERELPELGGYRGSRPVRVGNGAEHQLQLDIYGSVVLAAFDYARRGGRLGRAESRRLHGLARTVCELWQQPDSGIWEIRGEQRHHVYSKVMCWVALDRLLRLHEAGVLRGDGGPMRHTRDRIAAAVREHGLEAGGGGGYVGCFGGEHMDAALLLLARSGFEDPRSPRMRRTFERIDAELSDGPLIWRYPVGSDGFGDPEGAFGVCSFWGVEYLARCGRLDAAASRFEALLGYANDVGLYGEQIDPASGAALGNFPQAFTHVGLINAALMLEAGVTPRSEVLHP